MDSVKPLEAKVAIHRLSKRYKELNDMPYPTREEKEEMNQLMEQARQVAENVVFKNEIDQADFDEFLDEKIGEHNFTLREPEGKKIHDEQLTEELDDEPEPSRINKPLPQIEEVRKRKGNVEEEIALLQRKKKDLELLKKKENLKKQVEKMEDQIKEQQKEESYLTDKKDKEGIIKLRHDKYNKQMDEIKWEEYEINDLLTKELAKENPDQDVIATCKEALKNVKARRNRLRQVKLQTYFQNAMVKIPKKIASVANGISELSGGLSKMGNETGGSGGVGNMNIGDNPFDLSGKTKTKKKGKKGKKSKKNNSDFGFNEESFFNL